MKSPTGAPDATSPSPPKKRVGPITFIGQVRSEAKKVTWTSYKETWIAAVMVAIMVVVAAIFFYGTDSIVKLLVWVATGIEFMSTGTTGTPPNG
jgi:preprotein translocase subunit SecE